MKKTLITLLVVALLLTTAIALIGCNNDDTVNITKTELTVAKNAKFKVGDEFSTSKFVVTSYLSDETTKTPAAATLNYNTDNLKLDADNKFTEAGKFTLTVNYLDQILSVEFTVTD